MADDPPIGLCRGLEGVFVEHEKKELRLLDELNGERDLLFGRVTGLLGKSAQRRDL